MTADQAQRPLPDVPPRALRGELRHQSVDGPAAWARDGSTAASQREWNAALSQAHRARRGGRTGAAGRRRARSRVHRQRRGRARPQGAAGALPSSGAPARGAAFRGGVPDAAGARRWSIRCASCRRASCSKAPATACSITPATCSGWATASARMRRRSARSRSCSGVEVTPLELADPRFYHMDTALSAAAARRGDVRAGGVHRRRVSPPSATSAARTSASRSRSRMRASSPPMRSASATRWCMAGCSDRSARARSKSAATASRRRRCDRSCAAAARRSA